MEENKTMDSDKLDNPKSEPLKSNSREWLKKFGSSNNSAPTCKISNQSDCQELRYAYPKKKKNGRK